MTRLKAVAAALLLGGLMMAQDSTKDDAPLFLTHPSSLTFTIKNGEPLVSINLTTGQITYGKDYTPDKAAQEFWQAMAHKSPDLLEKRIKELEAQLAACKEDN